MDRGRPKRVPEHDTVLGQGHYSAGPPSVDDEICGVICLSIAGRHWALSPRRPYESAAFSKLPFCGEKIFPGVDRAAADPPARGDVMGDSGPPQLRGSPSIPPAAVVHGHRHSNGSSSRSDRQKCGRACDGRHFFFGRGRLTREPEPDCFCVCAADVRTRGSRVEGILQRVAKRNTRNGASESGWRDLQGSTQHRTESPSEVSAHHGIAA